MTPPVAEQTAAPVVREWNWPNDPNEMWFDEDLDILRKEHNAAIRHLTARAEAATALRAAANDALGSLHGMQGILALHKLDNSVTADIARVIGRLTEALAEDGHE